MPKGKNTIVVEGGRCTKVQTWGKRGGVWKIIFELSFDGNFWYAAFVRPSSRIDRSAIGTTRTGVLEDVKIPEWFWKKYKYLFRRKRLNMGTIRKKFPHHCLDWKS
jgi:hypothetical protein